MSKLRVEINVEPEMSLEALDKYFAGQRRFRKSGIDIGQVRAEIDHTWERLRHRAG